MSQIVYSEMQIDLSRIQTHVTNSISYDDSFYAKCTLAGTVSNLRVAQSAGALEYTNCISAER